MTATGMCYPYPSVIAEIRNNKHLVREKPNNKTHVDLRAPRVATIHDVTKKLGQVLPHPSAVFHAYASADTPWVARTLSHYTPVKQGKVPSNSSTHKGTQFGNFICLVCASTQLELAQWGQNRSLINLGGDTTLELRISVQTTPLPSHLVFSAFP
jgi:hypothetical protein